MNHNLEKIKTNYLKIALDVHSREYLELGTY